MKRKRRHESEREKRVCHSIQWRRMFTSSFSLISFFQFRSYDIWRTAMFAVFLARSRSLALANTASMSTGLARNIRCSRRVSSCVSSALRATCRDLMMLTYSRAALSRRALIESASCSISVRLLAEGILRSTSLSERLKLASKSMSRFFCMNTSWSKGSVACIREVACPCCRLSNWCPFQSSSCRWSLSAVIAICPESASTICALSNPWSVL